MRKLQGSPWGKLIAVLVLLAGAFGAGTYGAGLLLDLPYLETESWQYVYQFQIQMEARQQELIGGVANYLRLQELDAAVEAGQEGGGAAYADRRYLQEVLEDLEKRMDPANTWFRYRLMSADGQQVLASNLSEDENLVQTVQHVWYTVFEAGDQNYTTTTNYASSSMTSEVDGAGDAENPEAERPTLVLECGVPGEVDESIPDEFYELWKTWGESRANFDVHLTGLVNLSALVLLATLYLLWTAGHKRGQEGIVLTWQEKVFFDLYAAVMAGVAAALIIGGSYVADDLYYQSLYYSYPVSSEYQLYVEVVTSTLAAVVAGVTGAVVLILRTLTVRLKGGCLARTTLLCRVVTWIARTIHEFFSALPFIWKAVTGFMVYVLFNVQCVTSLPYSALWLLLWCVINMGALLLLARWSIAFHRLRKGTRAIASGDMDYRIDTHHMPQDLRLQAEDLNNISVGLAGAVDEKMKSERFKAELITNVSHDLKTPLTSIINYVNLLKTTEQSDPKAQEYIEVLDRKSQRLKKLTEDLVEASKASTGVLSVNREKIGMGQLMDQALGEWTEKLEARKLTVVTSMPEGETWVYADGRHLWRVVDNLLSNCAKYAMDGTRVYLDLSRGRGKVTLSVKNISREPLNVPPERLMERFVRGEESRTTEGSGLGLSIARSLTELQGGLFELAVDGDLFKATVTLPQAN